MGLVNHSGGQGGYIFYGKKLDTVIIARMAQLDIIRIATPPKYP